MTSGGSRISQRTPKGGVRQPIMWQIICRKLHENEKKNWTKREARIPSTLPTPRIRHC